MPAQDLLSPAQLTLAHVRKRVPGYDPEQMGPSDPKATFTLVENYPLERLRIDPRTGDEHDQASNIDDGYYADLENKVLRGRSRPLVLSDAARAPEALLHDGWHRASIAKAAGMTHHRAFVQNLDSESSCPPKTT